MPVDERYRRQVELLVRTLPHVAQERCLALKGGTAINLFGICSPLPGGGSGVVHLDQVGAAAGESDPDGDEQIVAGRRRGGVSGYEFCKSILGLTDAG